jgi:hypothetical protein
MGTKSVYAQIPIDLKETLDQFASDNDMQKNEALIALLKKGLDYSSVQERSDQLQKRLADAERARNHLHGILSIPVGTCATCNSVVTLHDFVFQRCPGGHYGSIKIYPDFQSKPGGKEVLAAGLAIFGAVVAANHLLGGDDSTS